MFAKIPAKQRRRLVEQGERDIERARTLNRKAERKLRRTARYQEA